MSHAPLLQVVNATCPGEATSKAPNRGLLPGVCRNWPVYSCVIKVAGQESGVMSCQKVPARQARESARLLITTPAALPQEGSIESPVLLLLNQRCLHYVEREALTRPECGRILLRTCGDSASRIQRLTMARYAQRVGCMDGYSTGLLTHNKLGCQHGCINVKCQLHRLFLWLDKWMYIRIIHVRVKMNGLLDALRWWLKFIKQSVFQIKCTLQQAGRCII